jgi:micrococcal nuclease
MDGFRGAEGRAVSGPGAWLRCRLWTSGAVFTVVLTLALGVDAGAACETPPPPAGLPTGTIVRVIDGGTIQARIGRRIETVRYRGVNPPGSPAHRPDARQAWDLNRQLVERRAVRFQFDEPERDPEGRLLAYVYVGDVMVNAELVCRGYAAAGTGSSSGRYHEVFLKLEREAREAGRGFWPRVTVRDRLISVHFNATPATEALRAIERATGVPMVLPASLDRQTLTLEFQDCSVEEALRHVLGALNVGGMALVYGPRGRVTRAILVDSARGAAASVVRSAGWIGSSRSR